MKALFAALWMFCAQIGSVLILGAPHFEAAHFDHSAIYVFPQRGKAFSIALPPDVPPTANLVGFGSSGRSAYIQIPSAGVLHQSDQLLQIDFSPLRLLAVPGSGGLAEIFSVTNSLSDNLLVTAGYGPKGLCGAWEIDTSHGTHRPIITAPVRPESFCPAQIEPDGKRVLVGNNVNFKVVDITNGSVEFSAVAGHPALSPDGTWLAISNNGEITLFDGKTFSVRRRLRASSVDGHLVWSPDSTRLLFAQREFRCFLLDDYESLAVLEVQTGKKRVIPSSHCAVTSSEIGWIDVDSVSSAKSEDQSPAAQSFTSEPPLHPTFRLPYCSRTRKACSLDRSSPPPHI